MRTVLVTWTKPQNSGYRDETIANVLKIFRYDNYIMLEIADGSSIYLSSDAFTKLHVSPKAE